MSKKTKLELTWIGKENRPKLEPRILIEDPEKSYHAKHKVTENDIYDNMLIHGDNLLALKALEQEYSGKIQCVFIDPPYNTKTAFAHYDDGLEHSLWLSLIRDRLEIIKKLLTNDGSLWISIDDNEVHYLKVLCDEIFGRQCFQASFIWRKVDSPNDNKVPITPDHDYILCYTKNGSVDNFKKKVDPTILNAYRQPDSESEIPYRDRLLKKNGKSSLREDRPSMYFPIQSPDGTNVYPIHDDGREARWSLGEKTVQDLLGNNKIIWKQRCVNGSDTWVPYTREYAPKNPSRPHPTIWSDLDTTRQTKAHLKQVLGANNEFDTPKPEDLIERIIEISTNAGDFVLDSFLGSGTTSAVAHKKGRRWIGIELGDHCYSHCIPRLKKVIDGEDFGGITFSSKSTSKVKLCKKCKDCLCEKCSEKVGEDSKGSEQKWFGGGGFRFYELGPSLIQNDQWGNTVINSEFKPEMLSEAMCKLEGFTYDPSEESYWIHGNSTESDFIYVTTQFMTNAMLDKISDEVGSERSLLICCPAFKCDASKFTNLTLKKIPKAVLKKCEWGKDDYSLEIKNLPVAPKQQDAEEKINNKNDRKFGKDNQPSLFDLAQGDEK